MKKYTILFLLSVQILFSQEIVVKGQAFNSGEFNDKEVYIIKNDTINKLRKHSKSLYTYWQENSKFKDRNDDSYKKAIESSEVLQQFFNNKYYKTKTDSLGYFEINAKLSDSLFFESEYHTTDKYLVADLVKKKKIILKLKLEPCEVWPEHTQKPTKLYVLIGKKIKSWISPSSYCNGVSLDSRTVSKYSVVKNIYGDFKDETIQFTSYVHETPLAQNYIPFRTSSTDYEYCLFYILEYEGELIQIKYLFDDVYRTKEGRWASPLKPKGLFNTISPDSYTPQKISFTNPIEFKYEDRFYNEIYQNFPAAYNTVKDGKITVNYGYYVEDLFEIRKSGRLKEYDYLIK